MKWKLMLLNLLLAIGILQLAYADAKVVIPKNNTLSNDKKIMLAYLIQKNMEYINLMGKTVEQSLSWKENISSVEFFLIVFALF